MTTGDSNLAISPLGTYGLGSIGSFGSYDMFMPSSYMNGIGMYPSIFSMGGYGMNSMMQYPLMYNQMYNQIQTDQLNHAMQMQQGMNQYAVSANRSSDRALVQKILNNSDVKYYLDNLNQKVIEGDQKGIQEQFTRLRNAVLNTYSSEFDKMGSEINRDTSANEIVKDLYSERFGANLEADIKRNGHGAFGAGFVSAFRAGSHGQYVDQTLQYCFGRNIDQKEAKDTAKIGGQIAGSAANIVEKGAYGAIAGAGATGLSYGLVKLFGGLKNDFAEKAGKALKIGGKAGLVIGLLYGVYSVGKNIYNSRRASAAA